MAPSHLGKMPGWLSMARAGPDSGPPHMRQRRSEVPALPAALLVARCNPLRRPSQKVSASHQHVCRA